MSDDATTDAMTFPHTAFGLLVLMTQMPIKLGAAMAGASGDLLRTFAARTKAELESFETLNERLARADSVDEASAACSDWWSMQIKQSAEALTDVMKTYQQCTAAGATFVPQLDRLKDAA
jgi:hypothetical protein